MVGRTRLHTMLAIVMFTLHVFLSLLQYHREVDIIFLFFITFKKTPACQFFFTYIRVVGITML